MTRDESAKPSIPDVSRQQAALVAGLGYLAIFILGTFANAFVIERLIVLGDPATTATNLEASASLFRFGLAAWFVVMSCDALAAWALYIFLRPVNRSLSLLAAWLRLLFIGVFCISLIALALVLKLAMGLGPFLGFDVAGARPLIALLLEGYDYGVHLAFVFFGLHILVIGWLILRSKETPHTLGYLLLVASAGYLVDSFGNFLSPGYAANETAFLVVVAVPAVVAELSLTLWLLIKGRKVATMGSGPLVGTGAVAVGQLSMREENNAV